MPGVLPKGPVAKTRVNPKIFILYSIHKVGKTELLSHLPECCTLDFEEGTELYDMTKIRIPAISDPSGKYTVEDPETKEFRAMALDTFTATVIADAQRQAAATGKKPEPPYKFLAVDTLDIMEELCIPVATSVYKSLPIGKNFEGKTVLELPNGGGYYYLRNVVTERINILAKLCKYLILVCHVREKNLNKGGIDVSVRDLSLTGKLGAIVAASADAIGYLYREPGGKAMISFETGDGAVMGARPEHLRGKKFPFSWDSIYLNEGLEGL